MRLKVAFLASVAAGVLAACGGADNGSAGVSVSNNSSSAGTSSPAPQPSVSSSNTRTCQALSGPATLVGGDLLVAEQGPVGMILLANRGLSQYLFWVVYDNVFGIPTIENRQDRFGAAQPFPPGTPVGASTQVQLQPPSPFDLGGQTVPAVFPKGIPVELLLRNYDGGPVSETNTSTTAAIGKDLWPDGWPTASVTYGTDHTATVTFFAASTASFSVGLTNVCGSGSL
jgi:hypothetical protein